MYICIVLKSRYNDKQFDVLHAWPKRGTTEAFFLQCDWYTVTSKCRCGTVFRSRGPFRRAFLLGNIAQYEANDSVCQSHAGSFCFCTIARGSRQKHLFHVPNRGTRVRAVKMYHTFSAVRWITSVCAEHSGLFNRMIVKLKMYSDDGKKTIRRDLFSA